MKALPLLLLCAAIAAAVAWITTGLAAPGEAREFGVDDPDAARLGALDEAIRELRASNEGLRAELAALRATSAGGGVSREPVLEDLVAQAVARAMAETQPGAPAAAGASGATAADFDAEASLTELLSPMLTSGGRERLWREAHEAGQTEALIALVEARAKADPENVALQYELANAYIQPIVQGEAVGIDAGTWSMKADAGYDAVLALDPDHWDARFSKAVSYSFWPPVFGKQQAAIDHFEILVGKQANMAPRPEFAQTYLFLGNMYEQSGNAAKAKEAWNLGLAAFPQDRDLRRRLGLE